MYLVFWIQAGEAYYSEYETKREAEVKAEEIQNTEEYVIDLGIAKVVTKLV